MKKIILMLIACMVTFAATESFAAQKKEKTVIATVELKADIDCENCVKKVMNYLPTQKGIKDVKVDLPTKVIKVSYDSGKTSTKNVITLLSKIGVKAKVVEPKKGGGAK
ncbi:MAG: cation transporter [Rikenellaceae bacterium]